MQGPYELVRASDDLEAVYVAHSQVGLTELVEQSRWMVRYLIKLSQGP